MAEFVGEDRAQLADGEGGEQRQADQHLAATGDLRDGCIDLWHDHDARRRLRLRGRGQPIHLGPQVGVLVASDVDTLGGLGPVLVGGPGAISDGDREVKCDPLQQQPGAAAADVLAFQNDDHEHDRRQERNGDDGEQPQRDGRGEATLLHARTVSLTASRRCRSR